MHIIYNKIKNIIQECLPRGAETYIVRKKYFIVSVPLPQSYNRFRVC